jgi:hypothetical protein
MEDPSKFLNHEILKIDDFQQNPSVEFNGNFTLLEVWKMESQCKFEKNSHSQISLKL